MRILLFNALVLALFAAMPARAESWEEKAWRQLHKKMTVELADSKLSDACKLVADITGLTIILDPKVQKSDTVINLKVTDMDAGTFIKWLTKLSETHAEVKDQAIFITDKPSEAAMEEDKTAIALLAASMHVEVEIPPTGIPLTEADAVKIALKLIEKENVKPTNFPGPDVGIGNGKEPITNPFEMKQP